MGLFSEVTCAFLPLLVDLFCGCVNKKLKRTAFIHNRNCNNTHYTVQRFAISTFFPTFFLFLFF